MGIENAGVFLLLGFDYTLFWETGCVEYIPSR